MSTPDTPTYLGTPHTFDRERPTSFIASPSVALALAVIHTVQNDEGKREEAKTHLDGRAGERRLSKSRKRGAPARRQCGSHSLGRIQRQLPLALELL